jgi:hypothetical protein
MSLSKMSGKTHFSQGSDLDPKLLADKIRASTDKGLKQKERSEVAEPKFGFDNTRETTICHNCHKTGHIARMCKMGKSGPRAAKGGKNGSRSVTNVALKEAVTDVSAFRDVNRELGKQNVELVSLVRKVEAENTILKHEISETVKAIDTNRGVDMTRAREEISRIDIKSGKAWNWRSLLSFTAGSVAIVGSFFTGDNVKTRGLLSTLGVLGICDGVTHGFTKPATRYTFLEYTGEEHVDLRSDEAQRMPMKHIDPLYAKIKVEKNFKKDEVLTVSLETYAQITTPSNMRPDAQVATTWGRIYDCARTLPTVNVSRYRPTDEIIQNTAELAFVLWKERSSERKKRLDFQ